MNSASVMENRIAHHQYYLFLGAVLLFALFRIFIGTSVGLSDDEAYYWNWAQAPSWSYYDHPGMVAWLIHITRTFFNDTVFAVRLPAFLLNTLGLILLWKFTQILFGSRSALLASLLYALTPLYSLGGLMIVPDIPMSLCWILVLWLGWKTLNQKNHTALRWLLIGVIMGLGTVSKYTMVFAGLSLIIFVILTPKMQWHLKTPWPWLAIGVWALLSLPIVIWNSQNDWVSFQFQFSQRLNSPQGFSLARWAAFWVTQMAYLTPPVFILFISTLVYGIRMWRDLRWRYLICFAIPSLIIFSYQAATTEFKPHWPAPAYLSLLAGSGFLIQDLWQKHHEKLLTWSLAILLLINLYLYGNLLFPLTHFVFKAITPQSSWNPKWDPTNDLYGWPEAAEHVKKLQTQNAKNTGLPFLSTHRYEVSGPLSFATEQTVYTFSEGKNAYKFIDKWNNFEKLKGQNSIVVSHNRYEDDIHKRNLFRRCKVLPSLSIERQNIPARTFYFHLCKNFKGY